MTAQRAAPRLPQPPADGLDDPQGAQAARLQDELELVIGEDQPEEVRASRLSLSPRDGPHGASTEDGTRSRAVLGEDGARCWLKILMQGKKKRTTI